MPGSKHVSREQLESSRGVQGRLSGQGDGLEAGGGWTWDTALKRTLVLDL